MTMRSIETRFWSDGWVRKLNPLDRYLFIYLLTNEHTTWGGVYELDISMMAFESGIDERDLQKAMLPKLEPKVFYLEGWIFVPNWAKYHLSSKGTMSPQQQEGFKKAWGLIPTVVKQQIKEINKKWEGVYIPYGEGMVRGVPSSLSSSLSLSSSSTSERESTNSSEYTKDFLSFWEVYPRKVGKGEAFKAWKKIKLPPLTSITKAVEEQKESKQWKKEDGRFIPNPATWLNQRRWEDEVDIKSNNISSYV